MLSKDQQSEREKFRTIYEFHLKKTYNFFLLNKIPFLDVNYNQLMQDSENELKKLFIFLGVEQPEEVNSIVKPNLYRNRNEK
jgi:hypothetical protein